MVHRHEDRKNKKKKTWQGFYLKSIISIYNFYRIIYYYKRASIGTEYRDIIFGLEYKEKEYWDRA